MHNFLHPNIGSKEMGASIKRIYNWTCPGLEQWVLWVVRKEQRGYSRLEDPQARHRGRVEHDVSEAVVRRPTRLEWRIHVEK